jgi:hypothetical protein
MTPLACELLEDLYRYFYIRPPHPFKDERTCGRWLREIMNSAKFFECTAVTPLASQLSKQMYDAYDKSDRVDQRLAFLPAVVTWIETEHPSLKGIRDHRGGPNEWFVFTEQELAKSAYNYRTALICVGNDDTTKIAQCYRILYETPRLEGPRIWHLYPLGNLPLVHSRLKPERRFTHRNVSTGEFRDYDRPVPNADDFHAYAHLALINTPRVIGQTLHYPYQRIEREKLKKHKLIGKFPLRAWTEIVLRVTTRPEDRSTDEPLEAHLTGDKCLHYCRTYLRIRNGMLEYVEGHWRGNPALGMKRSRYRVAK